MTSPLDEIEEALETLLSWEQEDHNEEMIKEALTHIKKLREDIEEINLCRQSC